MSQDLITILNQSIADKIVKSAKYPIDLFDINQPFPHKVQSAFEVSKGLQYDFTSNEIKDLLTRSYNTGSIAVDYAGNSTGDYDASNDNSIEEAVLNEASLVVMEAKSALKACTDPAYEGPPKEYLETIIKKGVPGLYESTAKGIKFKFHIPKLSGTALSRPDVIFNSPATQLKNGQIRANATGELWMRRPSIRCSRLCTRWRITWKWVRVFRISISLKFKIEALATASIRNSMIVVQGKFTKFRLDYKYFRKIKLEGIVNKAMADRLVYLYDTSKLIASIPVLDAQFGIDKVYLPAASGKLQVGVRIKKI